MIVDAYRHSSDADCRTVTYTIWLEIQNRWDQVIGKAFFEFAVRHFSSDVKDIYCLEERLPPLPPAEARPDEPTVQDDQRVHKATMARRKKLPRVYPRLADLLILNNKYQTARFRLQSELVELEHEVKLIEASKHKRKARMAQERRRDGDTASMDEQETRSSSYGQRRDSASSGSVRAMGAFAEIESLQPRQQRYRSPKRPTSGATSSQPVPPPKSSTARQDAKDRAESQSEFLRRNDAAAAKHKKDKPHPPATADMRLLRKKPSKSRRARPKTIEPAPSATPEDSAPLDARPSVDLGAPASQSLQPPPVEAPHGTSSAPPVAPKVIPDEVPSIPAPTAASKATAEPPRVGEEEEDVADRSAKEDRSSEDEELQDVLMTVPEDTEPGPGIGDLVSSGTIEDTHISPARDETMTTTIPEAGHGSPVADEIEDGGELMSTSGIGHVSTATLENPTPASVLPDGLSSREDFSDILSPRSDQEQKKLLVHTQEKLPNGKPHAKTEFSGIFDDENEDTQTTSFPDDIKKELGSSDSEASKKWPKTEPLSSSVPPPKPGGVGLTHPNRGQDLDLPNLATTGPASDELSDGLNSILSS
jgi:hypothetical protein